MKPVEQMAPTLPSVRDSGKHKTQKESAIQELRALHKQATKLLTHLDKLDEILNAARAVHQPDGSLRSEEWSAMEAARRKLNEGLYVLGHAMYAVKIQP